MLTDYQKAQIRAYLGFGDQFRYRHTRLESVLTNLSDDGEVLVASYLESLATIDQALLTATTVNAGIKKVDEIEFFANGSSSRVVSIKNAGRQYVSRLSILLGVPIYGDYFGSGGWPGDTFSGLGSPMTGGGSPRGGGFFGLG